MRHAERCSVHIVTWNAHRHLPVLFRSLDRQDTSAFTVTVVDNASGDGTAEWVRQERPDIIHLRNFRNLGFAKAHNQAIALAWSRWGSADLTSRYILIANPDIAFGDAAIGMMMRYMDEHPHVSACCPKLLRMAPSPDEDDPLAAVRSNIIDAVGIVMRKSRRAYDRGAGEEDAGQYDAPGEVFGASGACALFRASALADAAEDGAVFDEDFFAYKEDVDLAWRLRRLGHVTHAVPDAVVWHERIAKSDARGRWRDAWRARRGKSSVVNFFSTRNHGWLLVKNEDVGNAVRHALRILPYEGAKFVVNAFSAPGWRAMGASLAGFGKMWKKRRALAARRRAAGADIRKWFV